MTTLKRLRKGGDKKQRTTFISAANMSPMTVFRTLVNIDDNLLIIFKEIEKYFVIELDKAIIEKIFKEAEEDQVSEKKYLLFQGKKKFISRNLVIEGTVDDYEPESIWIKIQNIKENDVKHFNELVSS